MAPPRSSPPPAPTSTRGAGRSSTSSSSPATPTSTTRRSGRCSSRASSRGAASGSGIIAQPRLATRAEPFRALGRPRLFFGVTAGNLDSMLNRLTAQKKNRSRGPVQPGRPHRLPARTAPPSSTRSAAARPSPDVPDRARRHRGLAAAHRPLRLLERQGPPLDPARRQGRPARLRHGRAAGVGGRRPAAPRRAHRRRSATCAAPRTSINDARDGGARGRPGAAWPRPQDGGAARRTRRSSRDKRAFALMSRAFQIRDQPGQRAAAAAAPRRPRRLLQPAGAPAGGRAGTATRVAMDELYDLPFNRVPHPTYTERDPRLRDGEALDRADARLLRRLHLLLDHRARGARHPEPLGRERAARGARAAPHGRLPRHDHRPRRPDRQHVQDEVQERGRSRATCRRLSCVHPGVCENLETDHGPLIDLMQRGARGGGRQARLHRLRRALRPRRALARVRRGARRAPRRRAALGRARARRRRACSRR